MCGYGFGNNVTKLIDKWMEYIRIDVCVIIGKIWGNSSR